MPSANDPSSADANRPADVLSRAAADLLGEVVRNTTGDSTPTSPEGRALLERLVATLPEPTDRTAMSPESARAMVVVALDRVPANQRGGGWDALIDAVTAKLFESEYARGQLETLWRSILERRGTR